MNCRACPCKVCILDKRGRIPLPSLGLFGNFTVSCFSRSAISLPLIAASGSCRLEKTEESDELEPSGDRLFSSSGKVDMIVYDGNSDKAIKDAVRGILRWKS